MNKEKKQKVLIAATRVFAENGYHNATITGIVKASGFSTGLIYSYFLNKDDIILSIVLGFFQKLNQSSQEVIKKTLNPVEALLGIVDNFLSLCNQDDKLPVMKVLSEAWPQISVVKNKKLLGKRRKIYNENATLMQTIDGVILAGQKAGLFNSIYKPSLLRAILGGSIRAVLDGLYYGQYQNRAIDYTAGDALRALKSLIREFIQK